MSFKEFFELLCQNKCPADIKFDGADTLYGCTILSVADDGIIFTTNRGNMLWRRLSDISQVELSKNFSQSVLLDALKKQ